MGKQDEEHHRSGYLHLRMLLLRAVHDTRDSIIDSAQVLSGASFSKVFISRFWFNITDVREIK